MFCVNVLRKCMSIKFLLLLNFFVASLVYLWSDISISCDSDAFIHWWCICLRLVGYMYLSTSSRPARRERGAWGRWSRINWSGCLIFFQVSFYFGVFCFCFLHVCVCWVGGNRGVTFSPKRWWLQARHETT